MLINHVKGRQQTLKLLKHLKKRRLSATLFFCFINYAVKDLHEKDIFNTMILPVVKDLKIPFYTIDINQMHQVMSFCDVMVANCHQEILNYFLTLGGKSCIIGEYAQPICGNKDIGVFSNVED